MKNTDCPQTIRAYIAADTEDTVYFRLVLYLLNSPFIMGPPFVCFSGSRASRRVFPLLDSPSSDLRCVGCVCSSNFLWGLTETGRSCWCNSRIGPACIPVTLLESQDIHWRGGTGKFLLQHILPAPSFSPVFYSYCFVGYLNAEFMERREDEERKITQEKRNILSRKK